MLIISRGNKWLSSLKPNDVFITGWIRDFSGFICKEYFVYKKALWSNCWWFLSFRLSWVQYSVNKQVPETGVHVPLVSKHIKKICLAVAVARVLFGSGSPVQNKQAMAKRVLAAHCSLDWKCCSRGSKATIREANQQSLCCICLCKCYRV